MRVKTVVLAATLLTLSGPDPSTRQELPRRGASEEPQRFARSSKSSNGHNIGAWNSALALPGPGGGVHSITANADYVFVAGRFGAAGSIKAENIARFDRATQLWEPLGNGIQFSQPTDFVNDLAVLSSGTLYVSGRFSEIDDLAADGFAMWDGSQWSVPSGSQGAEQIAHLEVHGDRLYAIGSLLEDNRLVRGVIRYSGMGWERLSEPLSAIADLEVLADNEFMIAGAFPLENSDRVAGIGHWNGVDWEYLDSEIEWDRLVPNARVTSISFFEDRILAGGTFSRIGGTEARGVALWNGTRWDSLGDGVDGIDVFAEFNAMGEVLAHSRNGGQSITKWNGATWDPIGPAIQFDIQFLHAFSSDVFIGGIGAFGDTTPPPASTLLWFSNGELGALGGQGTQGISGSVFSIDDDGESIYVAGRFDLAGSIAAGGIAKRAGRSWIPVGQGVRGTIYDIEVVDSQSIYAAGNFTLAADQSVTDLAFWDGASWAGIGNGVVGNPSSIHAVKAKGNRVYIGGRFGEVADESGTIAAANIAYWEKERWHSLGSGTSGLVSTISLSQDDKVYVGGEFTLAGNATASGVAVWDGASWAGVGTGFSRPVDVLQFCGNDLYAGGNFVEAEGAPGNHIARWDGASWSALGTGTDGDVLAIGCGRQGDLFAAGRFFEAGGNTAFRIARWDGSIWEDVGEGVSSTFAGFEVAALRPFRSSLFIGGRFDAVGSPSPSLAIPSANIGEWLSPMVIPTEANSAFPADLALEVFPNPTSGEATISYSLRQNAASRLKLYDLLGRLRYVQSLDNQARTTHTHTMDFSMFPRGTYFVTIESGEEQRTQVLVVL